MTCALKRRFQPQISTTNPNITPPSGAAPVWTPVRTVEFTYPYVSPTLSLEIRAPDLGDETALVLKRVNNTTRGGTQKYFRDSEWPEAETLTLGFSALDEADSAAVFEFLSTSLGQEVGLLDWLSVQWRGIITDPSGSLIVDGVQCSDAMSITFRGRRV